MPLDIFANALVCAPLGKHLKQRLGPCHAYSKPGASDRPLFSREEAERIAGNWRALPPPEGGAGYDALYSPTEEAFRFYDAAEGVWHTWTRESAGVATLYPIGEGAWSWDCATSGREEPAAFAGSSSNAHLDLPRARPYRVFIVDDSAIIRSLLAQYIASEPGLTVCGTAASGAEALEQIPPDGCDLALVDVSMPGMSGIELVRRLRNGRPELKCLMLSAHEEGAYVAAALSAGAGGYTTKEEPEVLVEAIWRVIREGAFLSERTRALE